MSDVIQVNPLVFGGNGGVEIPFMTKLWENPDPTSEFAAQTINLASSDYDFLMFTYRYVTTDSLDLSKTFKKGDKVVLDCSFATSAGARAFTRLINYTSDTSLTAGQAQYATAGTAATIANNFLIPLAIYGFKNSYDIEDVAIANVSTSATKCIMSDNVTTVEQAITSGTTSDGLHNVTLGTNFSVSEYFNYFKIGKLVVVNIGGLITANDSTGIGITSDLPIQRSRPIGVLKNDVSSKSTMVFGQIGTKSLAIAAHDANVHYWGQFVYLTD